MRAVAASCAEALDPFGHCLRPSVELACGSGLAQSAIHHGTNHSLSTFWRQVPILVSVHSVLRESLLFGDISVPSPHRMDKLVNAHISARA